MVFNSLRRLPSGPLIHAGCRCPSGVGNDQPALQTAGKMDGGEITRRMSFVGSNENAQAAQPAPRQRSQRRAFGQIVDARRINLDPLGRIVGFPDSCMGFGVYLVSVSVGLSQFPLSLSKSA